MELIKTVCGNLDNIGSAILMILGGFSALAFLTPTKADDKFIQKLIDIIHTFGLTKKK